MARLEVQIAALLQRLKTLTGRLPTTGTCESASGGRIADKLTNVPGSSDYFMGAVVSYSNDIKMRLLGVKAATLAAHGAVSRETAKEMAEGGCRRLRVDICVSDTGIAGPGGATPRKPVGLFYMGLAAEGTTTVQKHVFFGSREQNKAQAVAAALTMLRDHLKERVKKVEKVCPETHVVTAFLENGGRILIVRRSRKVGSYRGRWSGVSGYLESTPLAQARREIREETGLSGGAVRLVRKGRPVEAVDVKMGRRWIVHPFLFETMSCDEVKLDWENVEARWIDPADLADYETVPGLEDALNAVRSERPPHGAEPQSRLSPLFTP